MATEECVIDQSAINYARMLIERGGGMASGAQHLGVYVAPDESFVDKCPCAWVFFPIKEMLDSCGTVELASEMLAMCISQVSKGRAAAGLSDGRCNSKPQGKTVAKVSGVPSPCVDGRYSIVVDESERLSGGREYRVEFNSSGVGWACIVRFQNGEIAESGPNGVGIAALLTVVEDHLLKSQVEIDWRAENVQALVKIQEALDLLSERKVK